jgi:hypothetical protein
VLFFLGIAEFLAGFSMDYVTGMASIKNTNSFISLGIFGNQNMLLMGSLSFFVSILICFGIYNQNDFFAAPTYFDAPWYELSRSLC